MAADEQARDSLEESTDPGADRTERVAAISFADAKKALGEDTPESEQDEQPTRKMGALSAGAAAKVVTPSTSRSVRVFKNPSKPPPPRLELPLATAQHQAIVDESPAPSAPRNRGRLVVIVLALAFALGAGAAWATHSTPASPTPPQSSPPVGSSPPSNTSTSAEVDDPVRPRFRRATPPRRQPEPTGEERAETLLEEAASLRGNDQRVALEAAASADPTNPHVAAALAEFYMENNPHQALEWALTASQLRRRRASYQDLIGDAYERIGNMSDAAHARATAVELREGD